MKTTIYQFYLWTLSPVHVGSGQTFDPTCAYFDRQEEAVVYFDALDFSRALSGEQRHELTTRIITKVTRENPGAMLRDVYRFVERLAPRMQIPKRSMKVPVNMIGHFHEMLQSQELAQFIMDRSIRDEGTGRLYIPGSSVKGALRTVWLEYLTSQRSEKGAFDEKTILGRSFHEDPFRDVRVVDFRSLERDVPGRVYYARNHKRQKAELKERDGSLHQMMEAIIEKACLSGQITIQRSATVKRPVDLRKLLETANTRHEEMMKEESRLWAETLGQDYAPEANLDKLKASRNNPVYLLRIGKHSGAEAVTVNGYRRIRIMKGKKEAEYRDAPTTFWFAADDREAMSGAKPFGWVALELRSVETYGR